MLSAQILVVEDDEAIRDIIQYILESAGFTVSCARHGKEALQLLETAGNLPSLILLDLMMPIMNGWEFLRAREEEPSIAGIPVIVLSASGTNPPPGVAAAFPKPLDLGTLLDLAHEYCQVQEPSEISALLPPTAVA
jgi:CheY-like chemotaxis protein